MLKNTAIITGITGQDGSHLADLLLEKDYTVVGIVRRISTEPPSRMRNHLWDKVIQYPGDLLDSVSIENAIQEFQPTEFYNLAAQSHVGMSWKQPELTTKIDYLGVLNVLKAIHLLKPDTRFYQASTSEMFGKVEDEYQSEKSRFYPRSPYAVAKLAAHWLTINYRESYGMHASCGILFNHEGPRRGKDFVTRKITTHIAQHKNGILTEPLQLGNLNSMRDWGFAGDYVRAMWLMLQQEKPDDYVIGTGDSHSVREFVETAYAAVDIGINWTGSNAMEKGFNSKTDELLVEVNRDFFRPAEVDLLRADATKAKQVLGWDPEVSFKELVKLMVEADIEENPDLSNSNK